MDGAEHSPPKGESLIETTKPGRFVIDATPELIAALKDYGIFFSRRGTNRFAKGDPLRFSGKTFVEPNSGFLAGNNIFSLGAFSYSGSDLHPAGQVGRYCSIGGDVIMFGGCHPTHFLSSSPFFYEGSRDLFERPFDLAGLPRRAVDLSSTGRGLGTVEHDVWIGDGAAIGWDLTIGTGAVVGARSVVTKDVPPYSIVAGVPAKVINQRFPDDVVERLLATRWWDYDLTQFYHLRWDEPVHFIDAFEEMRAEGKLAPLAPPRRFLDVLADLGVS